MTFRDYVKISGEPAVRNPRMVTTLAMASHDRMNEVRADRRLLLLTEPATATVERPTVARPSIGLRRFTEVQDRTPANDNHPPKTPANDRGIDR